MSNRVFERKEAAPEFPAGLDWINVDSPLNLAQLRGKVVILDFWTYGCINCMHVIPELKRLEEEYPDELVVIGVHSAKFASEGDTESIRRITLRYGLKHPVVNDHDSLVWRTWNVRAWPTMFLIDPEGGVVGRYSGEGIYPIFKPIVDRLVREFEAKGLLDRKPLCLKTEGDALPQTGLSFPGKVLADETGQRLFVADTNHHRVIAVEIGSGLVTEVIGSGKPGFNDGDFYRAAFDHPQGMALEANGRILYVADTGNHALRRIDLLSGEVTTLAGTGFQADEYPPRGGFAPDVALNSPWDLEMDGDQLFIAMAGSHQIWVMDTSSHAIYPFAGSGREGNKDGPLDTAELAQPSGLALDGQGHLYFADSEGSSIRRADTGRREGRLTTVAGSKTSLFDFGDLDGQGTNARLQHPLGLVYHAGMLYVADTYNNKIKYIIPETGEVKTFAGSQQGWRDGTDPLFYEPGGIDAAAGKLYVADTNNHSIRVIDLETHQATTLSPKGIERFIYFRRQ